jgi:hypothetical protein
MKQKRYPYKVTDNISEFMSFLNIKTSYAHIGFNEKQKHLAKRNYNVSPYVSGNFFPLNGGLLTRSAPH